MQRGELDAITLAVRGYPETRAKRKKSKFSKPWVRPNGLFVFDCETTTDATQRLLFGCYRYILDWECRDEGLFYADDLPEMALSILQRYVAMHGADTSSTGVQELQLVSRRDLLKKIYISNYKTRELLVSFNLPFDLSRLAFDVAQARGQFAGGFSIGLWSYTDEEERQQRNRYRPRVAIKHIDSKRALMAFKSRHSPDPEDLIPDEPESGKEQKGRSFGGHFLDLRTLAFALSDRGHSLQSACEAFGVEHGKTKVSEHGRITEEYIDYNRRDVQATAELAFKLFEEYDKNPIQLQETKAFSPASIGKALLRAMGINPIEERQTGFRKYLGYAQTAFFGGRTSAHIRRWPVPVVYTDFLSMYPTVNSLLGLWNFVIARNIKVIDHCQGEMVRFLTSIRVDDLFNPQTWKNLTAFVRVHPDGDILPTRGMYNPDTNDWQVAVNYVYADRADDAMWFSLPDVVVSTILTGKVPKIVDAFRLEACGTLPNLKPIKLRGVVEIDPRTQDLFKVVIEQRKAAASRSDLPEFERKRLDKQLKVLANSTSYGIYAEMNPEESDVEQWVRCFGIDPTPFPTRVAHADQPGQFCFPPLASLITGAARLMLALLEKSVTVLGGTYAMEDTDSMAIVATKTGGLIACPGGSYRMPDGREAVKALSWKQIEKVSETFEALNPYDRDIIRGSVLKIEEDNFDPKTKEQRQLWCSAISAKRYALFLRDSKGPILLRATCPYCGEQNKGTATVCKNDDCARKIEVNNDDDRWSEHGLGHLLNPTDPESEDRNWIAQVWLNIIRRQHGLRTKHVSFADVPAVGRVTVSNPGILRAFEHLNKRKEYADQIKPFNFLLSCHISPFGHPIGVNPERFHLIAPFETNPKKWMQGKWIDQYSGSEYRVCTNEACRTKQTARVKRFDEVLEEYEFHPESKCADASGKCSTRQTQGLLYRRHIQIDLIKYIGKESNSLEEVDAGLIHSVENVYAEYKDPRRDEWETKIRPALSKIPLSVLQKETGLGRRTLIYARTGKKRPHPKNQRVIKRAIQNIAVRHNAESSKSCLERPLDAAQ